MKATGLQSLAIGLGEAQHAEFVCGNFAPSQTCLAARSNDPYHVWGLRQTTMKESVKNSVNIMRASLKATAAVGRQRKATGDMMMMPGTFIVDTQGIIRYAYYSQYAGDDPSIEDLIAFACIMRGESQGV